MQVIFHSSLLDWESIKRLNNLKDFSTLVLRKLPCHSYLSNVILPPSISLHRFSLRHSDQVAAKEQQTSANFHLIVAGAERTRDRGQGAAKKQWGAINAQHGAAKEQQMYSLYDQLNLWSRCKNDGDSWRFIFCSNDGDLWTEGV